MKNVKQNSLFAALMVLAVACGSQTLQDGSTSGSSSATSTGSSTNPASGSGNIYNLPAAYQQRIQIGGNNSSNASQIITGLGGTSKTLRVKITPLTAPNLVVSGFTNYNFQYGCASVSVTVNGSTQQTNALQVSGMTQASNSACAANGTSQTMDFSNIITGDGPVTITIADAEYDNCSRYGSPYPAQYGAQFGCSMASVWLNHQMAVQATVQVDGTYMAP